MSMWKKIKEMFGARPDSDEKQDEDQELIIFTKKEPIDVEFTKNFIAGGGMFLYSESEQEVLINLKNIIDNETIDEVCCYDEDLISLLNRLNIRHNNNFSGQSDFAFIKCEYLVAFDGSVMLSSHTNKGRKQEEMPVNLIIYATPDQFVSNVSEALQKLKSAKKDNLPSNISSVRGRNMHNLQVGTNSKNIYLILAEAVK